MNIEEWIKIKEKLKKVVVLVAALVPIILITGCAGRTNVGNIESNTDTNIKELVHYYSSQDTGNNSATITSEHLNIKTKDNNEELYDLPHDEFFVSIAPYIKNTHP